MKVYLHLRLALSSSYYELVIQKFIEAKLFLSANFTVSAMFPQIVIGRINLQKFMIED